MAFFFAEVLRAPAKNNATSCLSFSQTETNKDLLIKKESGHNRHKWLFLNQEGDEVGHSGREKREVKIGLAVWGLRKKDPQAGCLWIGLRRLHSRGTFG